MKKMCLVLAVTMLTACSNHTPTIDKTPSKTKAAVSSEQKAISWIENNLSPLHALKGQEQPQSIAQIMLKDNIAGVSIAFVDKSHIKWRKSYGYANLATSQKVTEKTVFTGASLSKPLTAMAALNMVEAGVLNLDTDVNVQLNDWQVPKNEFTEQKKVTLRHLISHRAGVKNDLWSSYLPTEPVPTLLQMLWGQSPSVEPATSVISTPGSRQKYSNPGYSIIQKLLEDASGKSFDSILDTLVLHPSGMTDSSFAQPMPEYLQQRRAIGYDENLQPYPYRLFPYKAAGGVWTTPTDMAKFAITLLEDHQGQNNILSKSMMNQVFAHDRVRLGFSKIFNQNSSDLIFRHYGSNQGFTCYLVGSVERKQAVVIMTNSDNGFALLDYVARAVAQFYQWDHLQPRVYDKYEQSIPTIEGFQGSFNNNDDVLTFSLKDNVLWLKSDAHQTPVELTPVSKSEFISSVDSAKFQFLRDRGQKDGPIKWVYVVQPSGNDNYAPKVSSD